MKKSIIIEKKKEDKTGSILYQVRQIDYTQPKSWIKLVDCSKDELAAVEKFEYSQHQHQDKKEKEKLIDSEIDLSGLSDDEEIQEFLKNHKELLNKKPKNKKKTRSRSRSRSQTPEILVVDNQETHLMGKFKKGDVLDKFINATFNRKKWLFLIGWKERFDGTIPKPSWNTQSAVYQQAREQLLEYLKQKGKPEIFDQIQKDERVI